jgi:hypothetical protein
MTRIGAFRSASGRQAGKLVAIIAVLILTLTLLPNFTQAVEDDAFSKANTLLFLTPHLDNIDVPSILH